MKPSTALRENRKEIREIVLAHRAKNPRVFGSVFRNEDDEQSDLDILVEAEAEMSLFDISRIRVELSDLLGVPVDVLLTESVPEDKWEEFVVRSREV